MKPHPSPASRLPIALLSARAARLVLGAWLLATGLAAAEDAPVVPRETVVLFNGRDLSAFYSWLPDSGHEDPDHVFTVVDAIDGAPAIRVSGQHLGGLLTRQRYANYKLVAEFRWGNVTWAPRADRARDSGILLHCQGEDGNAAKNFASPWLRAIEYQIIEGGTGDAILITGYERGRDQGIAPRVTALIRPGSRQWSPDGVATELTAVRLDWQFRDLGWKDALGFRGARDVEKPTGEWNQIEAICDGGDFTFFLNGVKVNEAKNGSFKEGKILLQSEGAEIYFRRVELQPLGK
jgi:hypothetical protein